MIHVYVVTWNSARAHVPSRELGAHLFDAAPTGMRPELVVVLLQEIAPLPTAFLGGPLLERYYGNVREAVAVASKKAAAAQDSETADAGAGAYEYVNVAAHNAGMTAVLVFVRGDVRGCLGGVETAGVGVGVHETGHKGAAAVRLRYWEESVMREESDAVDDSKAAVFTFVAAHLAPDEGGVQRRNEDWHNIARRLVFGRRKRLRRPSLGSNGSQNGHDGSGHVPNTNGQNGSVEAVPLLANDEDVDNADTDGNSNSSVYRLTSHLIVGGDLNYRTASTRPDAADTISKFPISTPNPSDPRHYNHLLAHDQLTAERLAGHTLQGLDEMAIVFPPTYKLVPPSPAADSKHRAQTAAQYSAEASSHTSISNDTDTDSTTDVCFRWSGGRWPSWCDRILFRRTRSLHPQAYTALPPCTTSDHRPVALLMGVQLGGDRSSYAYSGYSHTGGSHNDSYSTRSAALAGGRTKGNGKNNFVGAVEDACDPYAAATAYCYRPPIDPAWARRRRCARRKELAVGVLGWFVITRAGQGVFLALAALAVAAWSWWSWGW